MFFSWQEENNICRSDKSFLLTTTKDSVGDWDLRLSSFWIFIYIQMNTRLLEHTFNEIIFFFWISILTDFSPSLIDNSNETFFFSEDPGNNIPCNVICMVHVKWKYDLEPGSIEPCTQNDLNKTIS